MSKPKISVCVPFHWMKDWNFFLSRCLKSIEAQSFKDYEIVLTHAGSMPVNSNRAIASAKGEIVKLLYMDDYFYSPDALKNLAENFKGGWFASGCIHDDGKTTGNPHFASWNGQLPSGLNTIGSPSVVAFENKEPLLFDENLSWLLDCELYGRLYTRYGEPTILDSLDIGMGIGPHQMTNLLTSEQKDWEQTYISTK